ncbi:PLP-dependent transferase [Massilia sp. 9096]|uniref:PLP-dependent transferase n=1 Tax=Massilia sp. 9096 TaxID=1500894 RepID=UPI00055AB26C|nr:PLP-dependent transferase [Massilia sp. 9096]
MTGPRLPGFDTLSTHAGHAAASGPAPAAAMLETRIAALDGGVAGIACASAQAALHLAIATIAQAGSHVVAATTLPRAMRDLLAHGLPRFGVETTFVEARDLDAWRGAIRRATRLLVGPTIGGAGLTVLDLPRIGALAHEHGLPLLVDASATTPWLLQPLEHGADLVLHAAAGLLSGHGAAAGGLLVDGGTFDWQRAHEDSGRFAALCEPNPRFDGIVYAEESTVGAFALRARREVLPDFGAAIGPSESGAILHGLETLGMRMERHVAGARRIAAFLAGHGAVAALAYPELDGHPDRALAGTLLARGAGAAIVLRAHGGASAGKRLLDALRLFSPSAPAGGARSHAACLGAHGAGAGAILLSVGLEDADDLIDDLARALKLAHKGD